jgi:hypothetical protein
MSRLVWVRLKILLLVGIVLFTPSHKADARIGSEIANGFLVFSRLFADVTYRTILTNQRTGTISISDVKIQTGLGQIAISRLIFANVRGLDLPTGSFGARVELRGLDLDLQNDSVPPEVLTFARLLEVKKLAGNGIVEFNYSLANSGLDLSIYLDIENAGQFDLLTTVSNLHFSGNPGENILSVAAGLAPSGTLKGRLVRLDFNFQDTGLAKRFLTFAATSQNLTVGEFKEIIPKNVSNFFEGTYGEIQNTKTGDKVVIPSRIKLHAEKAVLAARNFFKAPKKFALTMGPPQLLSFEEVGINLKEGNFDRLNLEYSVNEKEGKYIIDSQADLAKEAGNSVALARRFLDGNGVPQNFAQAIKLLRQPNVSASSDARNLLARIYLEGLGADQNLQLAHLEASLAAAQGDGPAADLLEKIEAKMKLTEIGPAQDKALGAWQGSPPSTFIKNIEKAAMKGNRDAMRTLAESYSSGVGAPKHYVRAYMWASLGAAAGDRLARGIRDRILEAAKIGLITLNQIRTAQSRASTIWRAITIKAEKQQSVPSPNREEKQQSAPSSKNNKLLLVE